MSSSGKVAATWTRFMSGEIKPDGRKIRHLREQKGWNVEELASRAGCSDRTIHNLEKGAKCYKPTLAMVAAAFKLEFQELLLKSPEESEKRFEAHIKLSISYSDFDQSEDLVYLIETLQRFIKAQKGIEVISVKEGSVTITVAMTKDDLKALVAALLGGQLKGLPITEVSITEQEAFRGEWILGDGPWEQPPEDTAQEDAGDAKSAG